MKKIIIVLTMLAVMLIPATTALDNGYHTVIHKSALNGNFEKGLPMMDNANVVIDKKIVNGITHYNTQGNIYGWSINGWNSVWWNVKASDYKIISVYNDTTVINTFGYVNGDKEALRISYNVNTEVLIIDTNATLLYFY